MENGRLTHKEARAACDTLESIEKPYDVGGYWVRHAENKDYFYDSNKMSLDHRLVDKKTNKEVWAYYTDFYNGINDVLEKHSFYG